MQTKTINEVVRDYLIKKELPLHYYVTSLNRALYCLNELSFDFNFGPNVKEVSATITEYDRVSIPGTAVDVIGVYGLLGGRILPFTHNPSLTTIYNLEGVDKVPYPEDESNLPDASYKNNSIPKLQTYSTERPQVFNFGNNSNKYDYNIDIENSEIVLDPRHGLTKVYIRYLSESVSKTAANVILHEFEPVIVAYMEHETAKVDGSPQSKVALLKRDFYNSKSVLKGRVNPLSMEDILKVLYFN